MEPTKPQIVPESTGVNRLSETVNFVFATPRPVTLTELRPDAATGRYSATKPGNGETRVDTKAAISRIKADKERDAEKSAAARKIMEENAGEIKVMQAGNPQPKSFNAYYKRKRLAAQKAASEK